MGSASLSTRSASAAVHDPARYPTPHQISYACCVTMAPSRCGALCLPTPFPTPTPQDLASTLGSAGRVMVVGNGGIALELVYVAGMLCTRAFPTSIPHRAALTDKTVIWSMKHGHAGDAFFDLDAASFLLTRMQELRNATSPAVIHAPQHDGSTHSSSTHSGSFRNDSLSSTEAHSPSFVMCQGRRHGVFGHAVGPQWTLELGEGSSPSKDAGQPLVLEYGTVVCAAVRRH